MEERLQKLFAGVCSRRTAEAYIAAGRVTVNGRTAELGARADPDRDTILLDGQPIQRREKLAYVLLNKPRGYVCTLSDERGRRTVADLVRDCGARVYPVGRLDRDSEGLLLLTNDGPLARFLSHPSSGAEKVYEVTVSVPSPASRRGTGAEKSPNNIEKTGLDTVKESDVLERAADRLSHVQELEDGTTVRPAAVSVLGRTEKGYLRLSVTIREGKNRQVRRLCALCGLEVRRLRRVREHTLELGNLKPGRWRYLTEAEIAELRRGLEAERNKVPR